MLNFLIYLVSKFAKPIEGNPNVWLEKDYPIGGIIWREFLCGSCRGIYRRVGKELEILAVLNTKKNDNFDRALEWFEKSCRREGFALSFLEVGNPRLKEKLERRGFSGTERKMTKVF